MNKVNLTGRITSNPELRQTQNGTSVTQFTLAVSRPYQKDKQQESDFISVVAWRGTAEYICRNFHKGDPMEVCGTLRTRSYDDKRYPDVKHYVTEVYADDVNYTVQNKNSNSNGNSGGNGVNSKGINPTVDMTDLDYDEFEEVIGDGDLPF